MKIIFTLDFSYLIPPFLPTSYSGTAFQSVTTETRLSVVLYYRHYSSVAPLRSVSVLHLFFSTPPVLYLSALTFLYPVRGSQCLISTQPVCRVQHALIHTQSNVKHIIAHTFRMTNGLTLIISASAAAEGRCLQ